MSVTTERGDKNLDTSRALLAQTWTQQRLVNFLVAHVSFVGDLVSAKFFLQPSISPGILWLWCLRGVDVTVGHANARNCLFTNVPSDKRASVSLVRKITISAHLP